MELAKIRVSGVRAAAVYCLPIPKGIIGATVRFEYTDPMWDGLSKTVVFRGAAVKDVVNAGEVVTIPPEVVAQPVGSLCVGVYGVDAENNIAIPTLWADLGRIRGAADPSGDETTDDSLPVWAQIQAEIEELREQGGGSVSEETVRQMVDEYLAENPSTGTADITINGQSADESGNFIINTVSDTEIAQLSAALT